MIMFPWDWADPVGGMDGAAAVKSFGISTADAATLGSVERVSLWHVLFLPSARRPLTQYERCERESRSKGTKGAETDYEARLDRFPERFHVLSDVRGGKPCVNSSEQIVG